MTRIVEGWVAGWGQFNVVNIDLFVCNVFVCMENGRWVMMDARIFRKLKGKVLDYCEEVGAKACIVCKIVKSRMKWTGHVVRMKDERLPK